MVKMGMIELTKPQDIWEFHRLGEWIVIPTNGSIRKDGQAVVGRGLALQAKQKFPELPILLGDSLKKYGNHVFTFYFPDLNSGERSHLFTFPVKWRFFDLADLHLIRRSCTELKSQVAKVKAKRIYLPRVGCGNGKRDWETEVKPILSSVLDNRFYVVNNEN